MSHVKKNDDRISALIDDKESMIVALNKGVQEALLKHKLFGVPIVVWKDDKIVLIPPEKIRINKKR